MLDDAKVSTFVDTCNYFVKKSFHVEPESIGKRINDLIISKINSEKSDREVARKTGLSNTAIGNVKNGTSMKLDTMDQILKAYPSLKVEIANVFMGEIAEKHTAATKTIEAAVWQTLNDDLEAFRSMALSQQRTIEVLSSKIS